MNPATFSQYIDFNDFCTQNNLSPDEGFNRVLETINDLSTKIKKINEEENVREKGPRTISK